MLTTRFGFGAAALATVAAGAACFPSSSGGDVASNGDGGSSGSDGGSGNAVTFSCAQTSDSLCTEELAPESAMAAEQQVCTNEMGTFAVGPCNPVGVVGCCVSSVITQCYYSSVEASIGQSVCTSPKTWMAAGDGGAEAGGGGIGVTKLATGPDNTVAMAIDGTNVYWATQADQNGDGVILSVPIAGGAVTTLATDQIPTAIAVDTTTVYWTTESNVLSVPIGGGTATTVSTTEQNYNAVATGSGDLFWLGQDEVFEEPVSGGAATTLFTGTNNFAAIAIDSTNVYFSEFGTTTGGVRKIPIAGGTPTTIASYTGRPGAVAVDATNIYWLDATNLSISMAPLTGGSPVTLASTDPNNVMPTSAVDVPTAIAVDSTYVYWTNAGNGSVMSVPIAGGTPKVIAESVGPSAIAVDATAIYFLSALGEVDKLSPKPQ